MENFESYRDIPCDKFFVEKIIEALKEKDNEAFYDKMGNAFNFFCSQGHGKNYSEQEQIPVSLFKSNKMVRAALFRDWECFIEARMKEAQAKGVFNDQELNAIKSGPTVFNRISNLFDVIVDKLSKNNT